MKSPGPSNNSISSGVHGVLHRYAFHFGVMGSSTGPASGSAIRTHAREISEGMRETIIISGVLQDIERVSEVEFRKGAICKR
jgi:hypothetical protein